MSNTYSRTYIVRIICTCTVSIKPLVCNELLATPSESLPTGTSKFRLTFCMPADIFNVVSSITTPPLSRNSKVIVFDDSESIKADFIIHCLYELKIRCWCH